MDEEMMKERLKNQQKKVLKHCFKNILRLKQWEIAEILNITPTQVGSYVKGLTPLPSDKIALLKNHGFDEKWLEPGFEFPTKKDEHEELERCRIELKVHRELDDRRLTRMESALFTSEARMEKIANQMGEMLRALGEKIDGLDRKMDEQSDKFFTFNKKKAG